MTTDMCSAIIRFYDLALGQGSNFFSPELSSLEIFWHYR